MPVDAPADPLSEILRTWLTLRWSAGLAESHTAWETEVPDGVASLYAMVAGRARLTLADAPQQEEITGGEVLLLARGTAHRLQAALDIPGGLATHVFRDCSSSWPPESGAASIRVLYGHFSVAAPDIPFSAFGLDPVVRFRAESCPMLKSFPAIAAAVADEQSVRAPGWQAAIGHLVQTLLVQTLRAVVMQADTEQAEPRNVRACLLKAALDDVIGPALASIHQQPEASWTVASLAACANISKSTFSARFHELVGKPPLSYVTTCRMEKACRLLRDTQLGVKQISRLVGYESASSFTSAFRRCTGRTPAEFRRDKRCQSPPDPVQK